MLGRLGRDSEQDELFPVQVKFEDSVKIVGIAAGAYHSLALAGCRTFNLHIWHFIFGLFFCFCTDSLFVSFYKFLIRDSLSVLLHWSHT